MELEKILNSLLKMGRKPRGYDIVDNIKYRNKYDYYNIELDFGESRGDKGECGKYYSINDLVSYDSGMRKFVCENGLYGNIGIDGVEFSGKEGWNYEYEEYWIMLSTLSNHKDIFIISHIKTGTT